MADSVHALHLAHRALQLAVLEAAACGVELVSAIVELSSSTRLTFSELEPA